ncbi:MAG: helix-turn-helix transcriptional regulator [bacterium]|nr:helix-turn-helix transcriptional regulator [bacterium]
MARESEFLERSFGLAVPARREALGLSQERLAEEAGIHRTYVSQIERGDANPTLTVMAALASAVNVRLSRLIGEMESG